MKSSCSPYTRILALQSRVCIVQVRARVWPVLLGVDAQEFDERAYRIWQGEPHRDSNVVNCDVERSLWSYTEGEQQDRFL